MYFRAGVKVKDVLARFVTPHGVAHGLTGGRDRLGLQLSGPLCFEALKDSRDLGYHGSSPIKNRGGAPHPAEEISPFQSC